MGWLRLAGRPPGRPLERGQTAADWSLDQFPANVHFRCTFQEVETKMESKMEIEVHVEWKWRAGLHPDRISRMQLPKYGSG